MSAHASGRFVTPSIYAIFTSLGSVQLLSWPTLKPVTPGIEFYKFLGDGYATYMYDCAWEREDLMLTTHLYEEVIAYNLSKQTKAIIFDSRDKYPTNQRFFISVPYNGRSLFLPSHWLMPPHTSDNVYYECKHTADKEWPELAVVGRILSSTNTFVQITHSTTRDCYQLVNGHLFVALAFVDITAAYNDLPPDKRCIIIDLASNQPDLTVQIYTATTHPYSTRLALATFTHV
jgi:hypothetical protein